MKRFVLDGMVMPFDLVAKKIEEVIQVDCPYDFSLYDMLLKKAAEGNKKCKALADRIVVDDLSETEDSPKTKLKDVYLDLNIRRLSNRYFNQPARWLYNKLDHVIVNGKREGFSPEELKHFKDALIDFSNRVRCAAETL